MIEQLHCNETITIQRNANVVDWINIWNVWLFKQATENQEKVWLNLHGGCKWSPMGNQHRIDYDSSLSFQLSWKGITRVYWILRLTWLIRLGVWNLRLWACSKLLVWRSSLELEALGFSLKLLWLLELRLLELRFTSLWGYKLVLYSHNFCFTIICRLYYLRVVHCW